MYTKHKHIHTNTLVPAPHTLALDVRFLTLCGWFCWIFLLLQTLTPSVDSFLCVRMRRSQSLSLCVCRFLSFSTPDRLCTPMSSEKTIHEINMLLIDIDVNVNRRCFLLHIYTHTHHTKRGVQGMSFVPQLFIFYPPAILSLALILCALHYPPPLPSQLLSGSTHHVSPSLLSMNSWNWNDLYT